MQNKETKDGKLITYTREGTVVPEIAFVREAIANETELALLHVLLDGVEKLILGDLVGNRGQFVC